MKNTELTKFFAAVLMTMLVAGSAPAVQAAETKAGVVDVAEVTRRSSSIQSSVNKAESQVQERQNEVEVKMDALQKKRSELSSRRSILSEEQISKQESELLKLREEIDDLQHEINKQLTRIQSEIMDPEVERVMKAVKAVAKREGYDIVVRAETTLYFSDAVDLTPLVVKELDKPAGE